MADTYTALLRFILQADMANENQWGSIFNSAVTELVEEAIASKAVIDVTSGDVVLTSQNGLTDQSRPMFIEAIGNPGTMRKITVPSLTKLYGFGNNTGPTETVEIATATSASVEITGAQSPTIVFVDSVNDTVHTLGRANAMAPGSDWVDIDLYEEGQAGVVVVASWSKQGDYTSIYIPAFIHTFTGLIMAMREGGPAGTLSPELVINGPDFQTQDLIKDDAGGGNVPVEVVFTMSSITSRIQWLANGQTTFLNAVPRQLSHDAVYTYSTRSD